MSYIKYLIILLALFLFPAVAEAKGNDAKQLDFDHDKQITVGDIVFLADRFGSQRGDGEYRGWGDLNRDGFIDITDIVIVAGQVGN